MILTPGFPGVAFGTIDDGDGRSNPVARTAISAALAISENWATVHQTHSNRVVHAVGAGAHGDADGLVTAVVGLPLVVATADCVPVAIVSDSEVAIVHAGWRGVAGGIVDTAVAAMATEPLRALIGPHIGPCCYEVGVEVIAAVGGHAGTTTWGTQSVDLASAIIDQLAGIETVSVTGCSLEDARFASHRENATALRQVSIVWL
jgi:YfiH family protein